MKGLFAAKRGANLLVVDRKRNFVFLQKAERQPTKSVPFCRNTERTERGSFCQNVIFLQKKDLSAGQSKAKSSLESRIMHHLGGNRLQKREFLPTGISSQIRTKLCDWAVWQARA